MLLGMAGLLLPALQGEQGLRAQTSQDVEDVLDAGSTGGTRGYRLRRIGSGSATFSQNAGFVYYPASAIKIQQHFYAMALVQAGIWDLNTTNISNCTSGSNCADSTNSGAGCTAQNQSLNTILNTLMVNSSNASTNAIQEAIGTLWSPVNPNPAALGRGVMNWWGNSALNMTNSSINTKFGCVGACGAGPNELTLIDNERLYSTLAGNSILDNAHRVQLKDLALNEAWGYFDGIIDEEAAATNRNNIKAAFKNKVYMVYKAGSWTCSGGRYITLGGLIQLPTYGGAYKRLYTYGAYLDNTNAAAYSGGTVGDATREMMRSAIRGALLTWNNDYVGGTDIQALQNEMGPIVGQYQRRREGYTLQQAQAALSRAGGFIPATNSINPNFSAGMQELETAANLLVDANQTLADTKIDDIILKLKSASLNMLHDIHAYLVSTGDGSYLLGIMQSVEPMVNDAEDYEGMWPVAKFMATCVSVGSYDWAINWNLSEPRESDDDVGFAPISTGTSSKAAEAVSLSELDLEVWPNPAGDQVQIKVNGAEGKVHVNVFDLQGRSMNAYFQGIESLGLGQTHSFDTRKLPEGIFFLKVNVGNQVSTKKLIVKH